VTLSVLARLAETIHGGTLAIFAVLLTGARLLPQSSSRDLARLWRAAGATLGLTLGAVVALHAARWAVVLHPGAGWPDAFAGTDHVATQTRMVLLVCYVVTYTALEIWTNEPLRLLDRTGAPPADRVDATWETAVARVRAHLVVNAGLFLAYVAAGTLARV
jgi:hypothetical protein